MLVPAAAGPVLELGGVVHLSIRLCFFILWKVFAFVVVLACGSSPLCRHLLLAGCFGLDPDSPDKAQQFASHRSDDLALILARRR